MRGTLNHPGNNDVESPGVGTGKTLEKKFRGSMKGSLIIDHQLRCFGATGWSEATLCWFSRVSNQRDRRDLTLQPRNTDFTYVGYPLRPFPFSPPISLSGVVGSDRGLPLVKDKLVKIECGPGDRVTRAGLQTADRSRREWCIQGSALLVSTGPSMRMLQDFHE